VPQGALHEAKSLFRLPCIHVAIRQVVKDEGIIGAFFQVHLQEAKIALPFALAHVRILISQVTAVPFS